MKILWITNTIFPEAESKLLGKKELCGSGGWMLASAEALINHKDVELNIATVSTLVHDLQIINGEKITYYIIPYGKGNHKYNTEYETYWKLIKKSINPDIVHIHGTEYTHGLAYVNACSTKNVIVSIQGLKSGIAPYYCAGLSKKEIYGNLTFHDIIKGTIYHKQRLFYNTGELEKEILCKVNHIIGRTSWDKSHVWSINPKANYHECNETLRSEFYDGSIWNYDKCRHHSIFLSQGGYPLKGLHQVLKAMPLIFREFPDTIIRVAGVDITQRNGLKGFLHFTGYGKIIKRMIKKYNLNGKVTFLGPLNAEQMKMEYLNSNVFVCPSSIENSPNSLGEAQLLGVPCVASYVGGIPDFMEGNEKNMYRFEEVNMLSNIICKIFGTNDFSCKRDKALARHDSQSNISKLISIYKLI